MSKVGVIGHTCCPVCDRADAFVKVDKGGCSYIVCPDCGAQCFTRNEYRDKKLRAKMRPVQISTVQEGKTATSTVQIPPGEKFEVQSVQIGPAKQPVQPAQTPAVPKAPAAQKKAAPVDPAPNPPKKSAGWFSPLLAGGN